MVQIIRVGLRLSSPFFVNSPFSVKYRLGFGVADTLDLTIGHLRTNQSFCSSFSPLSHDFLSLQRWYRKPDTKINDFNLVLRVQPFHSGGYECTVNWQSIPDMVSRMSNPPPKTGSRVKENALLSDSDILRSIVRAKRTARLRIKSMGCDRLLTLTRRESKDFWTLDDWRSAWKKFVRLSLKSGVDLQYVACPEQHKKGNFHLHAAIVGKVHINTIRRIWWSCCGGHGMGNVDISFKPHLTDYERRKKVAWYVTKYITKQAGITDFNEKRYWASRHTLPACTRYVLASSDIKQALIELSDFLGLDREKITDKRHVFVFPANNGAWFSYTPDLDSSPPF